MDLSRKAPPLSVRTRFDRRDEAPRAASRELDAGVYRRRIIVRLDGERAVGELEDDFHHFRVVVVHDGSTVSRIEGSGVRSPWTVCLDAGDPLRMVEGTPLRTGPAALAGLDARRNCTHMFDLAGLVVTHAARGVAGDRRYDMSVEETAPPEPVPDDPVGAPGGLRARLWRDREPVLDWHIEERSIVGPAEWVDAPLWSGFIPWAARELDHETAEAAVALRRACDISRGRLRDLDELDTAEPLVDLMAGICHAFQPQYAPVAIRHRGSGRDFTDHPELLLADFDDRDR